MKHSDEMKGVNPLMVMLVTFIMIMVGLFMTSFFIRPIENKECEIDLDCSTNCTRMFPNPKCKDGECVCVAECMNNASCSYLGEGYSCDNRECVK
jgi:hypothetical protein